MTMPTPGGAPTPSDQPAYVDPITGSPLYVDPVTGQLAYGTAPAEPVSPTVALPATVPLPPSTPLSEPPLPVTAVPGPPMFGYEGGAVIPAGYPPAGYPPAGYPPAPSGFAYPIGVSPYGAPNRTNGLAIASLVVSISSFTLLFCYGVGAVVGLVGAILGHVSRRQVRERNENGSGMALAGIICGWISVAVGVIIAIFIVWLLNKLSTMDDAYGD